MIKKSKYFFLNINKNLLYNDKNKLRVSTNKNFGTIAEENKEEQSKEGFKKFLDFVLQRKEYKWKDFHAQILVI